MADDEGARDDVVEGIKTTFDRAGFRLVVMQVNEVPDTWHAVVLNLSQPIGSAGIGDVYAARTAEAAAQAADDAYRSSGRIE